MRTKMTAFHFLPAIGWLMAISPCAYSAIVSWDGGGGDFSWQNRTNWTDDNLPGTADEVTINVPGSAAIVSSANVTIRSLQCSNDLTLAGGTFRVTAGSSVVQGAFSTSGSPTLSAVGTNTDLLLASGVDIGSANLEARGGAAISVPTLQSYAKPTGCATVIWQANGAGSLLDFPHLTNLNGAACASLNIQAWNGGRFELTNLVSITEGTLNFLADGTNSLVNLPALAEANATQRVVSFEARKGGQVWAPEFPGSLMATVALTDGGVIPVTQLRELRGFTVGGRPLDFPAVTVLGKGNITVENGAVVSLPLVSNHVARPTCFTTTWSVNDTGSALNFPALTNITGADCGWIQIWARAGGTLLLTNVSTASDGTLYFEARGTNSLIDLTSLKRSDGAGFTVTFTAIDHGAIAMPDFRGGTNVVVSLQSDGILPAGQMDVLRGFEVGAMSVDFPALTNLGNGNIMVTAGGIATAPNLTDHFDISGCPGRTWLVTGGGSILSFPGLTNLAGPNCGFLTLRTAAGGSLALDQLNIIAEGTVSFLADGPGSTIHLNNLQESLAIQRQVSFEARNNGTMEIPLLKGGPTVNITIKSGGALDATRMTLLKGLTVSATSVSLPGISKLFSGDLFVELGAVLTFPNLFNHEQGMGCNVSRWSVSGEGSVLDLSSLTNLVGGSCGSLTIEALAAGLVAMSNLTSIVEGSLNFVADGTNSRIDLAALPETLAIQRTVEFEARNQGEIFMPVMKGGPSCTITLQTNGVMPISQIERLSGISVISQSADFTALTHFDGGSFLATSGAVITAPNLITVEAGPSCFDKTWITRGAGSIINLPGLTYLLGGGCTPLDVQALGGGQILMGGVTNIPGGTVYVLATDAGSVVDLHSLATFMNRLPNSRLVATNGGTILLRNDGTVLSGSAVNIAAGTPGRSTARLGATNTILFGRPWHSYWLERRDLASGTDWEFYKRVPLTNEFQMIGALAAADSDFRVWEFTADPFALELRKETDGIGVVLYSPAGSTFDILAAARFDAPTPWELFDTVAMTNTFRILPREPFTTPHRYFRVIPGFDP